MESRKGENNTERVFRKLGARPEERSFKRWIQPLGMTSSSALV